jgi:ribokinase
VHAVDTTCAGDTYIGALVAGYARGLTMEEAVAIATKASALATTKVGAQQSIPLLADVE